MNKIQIVKKIASSAASMSAGYTITTVVLANVPPQTSKLRSLEIVIGTLVIAGIVSDAAERYTDAQIDAITDFWTKKSEPAPTEA